MAQLSEDSFAFDGPLMSVDAAVAILSYCRLTRMPGSRPGMTSSGPDSVVFWVLPKPQTWRAAIATRRR